MNRYLIDAAPVLPSGQLPRISSGEILYRRLGKQSKRVDALLEGVPNGQEQRELHERLNKRRNIESYLYEAK